MEGCAAKKRCWKRSFWLAYMCFCIKLPTVCFRDSQPGRQYSRSQWDASDSLVLELPNRNKSNLQRFYLYAKSIIVVAVHTMLNLDGNMASAIAIPAILDRYLRWELGKRWRFCSTGRDRCDQQWQSLEGQGRLYHQSWISILHRRDRGIHFFVSCIIVAVIVLLHSFLQNFFR